MKQSWRMCQNLNSLGMVLNAVVITLALFANASAQTFKNAHDDPPPGWTGPVFKLSQNYPKTLPASKPYLSISVLCRWGCQRPIS